MYCCKTKHRLLFIMVIKIEQLSSFFFLFIEKAGFLDQLKYFDSTKNSTKIQHKHVTTLQGDLQMEDV